MERQGSKQNLLKTEWKQVNCNFIGDLKWSDEAAGLKRRALYALAHRVGTNRTSESSEQHATHQSDLPHLNTTNATHHSHQTASDALQTLRLHGRKITTVDPGLKRLRKVKWLSLAGNELATIEAEHLPPGLKFLSLNGN
jgi:hypothetical protein